MTDSKVSETTFTGTCTSVDAELIGDTEVWIGVGKEEVRLPLTEAVELARLLATVLDIPLAASNGATRSELAALYRRKLEVRRGYRTMCRGSCGPMPIAHRSFGPALRKRDLEESLEALASAARAAESSDAKATLRRAGNWLKNARYHYAAMRATRSMRLPHWFWGWEPTTPIEEGP